MDTSGVLNPLSCSGNSLLFYVFLDGLKYFFFLFFFFFLAFRAAPAAYEVSQARDPIGAVAIGLHHSHSHAGFEPCLRPIPQLTATSDP